MWVKEFQEPEGNSPNRRAGTSKAKSRQEKDIQKETSIRRRSGQNTHSTHCRRDFILFTNTYPFVQNIGEQKPSPVLTL